MRNKIGVKNLDENFWIFLRETGCEWNDVCKYECGECIFNAPAEEFKEWLKGVLCNK